MGTLSVQPPSGAVRSLTEVFVLLRNNAIQSRQIFSSHPGGSSYRGSGSPEDRMSLIPLHDGEDNQDVGRGGDTVHNRIPPEWVSVVDEVQYEITRIRSRLKELKDMQQAHLTRPSFNDDSSQAEEAKIEAATQELTKMLMHCQRLVQHIEAYTGQTRSRGDRLLLRNTVQSLIAILQSTTVEFRSSQSGYLKQVQTRDDSFQQYFETYSPHDKQTPLSFASSSQGSPLRNVNSMPVFDAEMDFTTGSGSTARQTGGELTMAQIQAMEENTELVKEREREILHVTKSIVELNTLFKDLAGFVVDQGTILDRIDFNIEQTDMAVKSGLKNVQKAERYQRKNKKMMCILILSALVVLMTFMLMVKWSLR